MSIAYLLAGTFNGKDLLATLLKLIDEEMIPDKKIELFRKKTYTSQNNYSGITEFKRLLNYFVSYKYRETLINQVSQKFGYKFNVKNFYISEKI